MHLHDTIADTLVLAALNTAQQLDGDPLLLALHQSRHDLGDAVLVQRLGLHVVDILLVILACLLLAWPLSDDSVPALGVVNPQSLDCRIRQFGRPLGLSPASNEASAIGLPAVAWLRICSVTVDIVVEDELLAGFDVPLRKDTHPELFAHDPLVHVAIGIARVIAKPGEVALLGRVDELTLVERHEVEMLDALFVVLPHATSELRLVDHLSDVLEDELVRPQVGLSAKPVALLLGLYDGNFCVLLSLKPLILALCSAAAISNAFYLGRTVDAIRVLPARVIPAGCRV